MGDENRRNYYRLLHVQPDAPAEVIKASYRTLMRTLGQHPDLGGDGRNAALINEAYAVLSDPAKRARYDRTRRGAKPNECPSTRPSSPPGPTEPSPAQRGARPPTRSASPKPGDAHTCAFCNTDTTTLRDGSADESCRACGSPLRAVDLISDGLTDRVARRIEHEADIHYQLDPTRRSVSRGQVVDLSPAGLRFVSRDRLTPGRVIRIDTPTLSAVARVIRCDAVETAGDFSTGVRFLTLRVCRPRGTFVSERA